MLLRIFRLVLLLLFLAAIVATPKFAVVHRQDLWRQQRPTMGWRQWNDLLAQRDCAWDVAEQASDATGFAFKDRQGQWRNQRQQDLTGLALRRWCESMGIEYN